VSSPYVGEIRMFGGNFQPAGWAFCDGQLLAIPEYTMLFYLIGTTYGGDGQTTFALPNLQGRLAIHQGSGFTIGETGGAETVTLTGQQMPIHPHSFVCSISPGGQRNPTGNVPAAIPAGSTYVEAPATAPLAPQSIQQYTGGGGSHDNMQPYQCVTFIISLYGIFPSQT
jgi:microcystin-dependent protein